MIPGKTQKKRMFHRLNNCSITLSNYDKTADFIKKEKSSANIHYLIQQIFFEPFCLQSIRTDKLIFKNNDKYWYKENVCFIIVSILNIHFSDLKIRSKEILMIYLLVRNRCWRGGGGVQILVVSSCQTRSMQLIISEIAVVL